MGEGVELKVGAVPQEATVDGLVKQVLGILGIEYGPPGPGVQCLVDTRARVRRSGAWIPGESAAVVFFDDFFDPAQVLRALQGKPGATSEAHFEPDLSVKAQSFFRAIRDGFWAKGLPMVAKAFWPRDAPGCLVLTHDVDWFDYSPAHRAVSRGKSVPKYVGLLVRHATGRRYGPNIDSIIQLEASLGVRSTFLFRNEYPTSQAKLPGAIRACLDSGCEVALHAARKSHKDPAAMVKEKAEIESSVGGPVYGLREHALKFEHDKTWRCIEKAGFSYDMTFGLNEKTGFVGGLCHPYHPIAPDGTSHSFLEIPTSLMDWTLIRQGMSYGGIQSLIHRLKDTAASLSGCVCVNFHNTYVDKDLFPDIERAYRLLITDCLKSGFWAATAQECAEWWARRERSRLRARVGGGGLGIDFDPEVPPRVYWPDGRAELWGETPETEVRRK